MVWNISATVGHRPVLLKSCSGKNVFDIKQKQSIVWIWVSQFWFWYKEETSNWMLWSADITLVFRHFLVGAFYCYARLLFNWNWTACACVGFVCGRLRVNYVRRTVCVWYFSIHGDGAWGSSRGSLGTDCPHLPPSEGKGRPPPPIMQDTHTHTHQRVILACPK